MTTAIENNASRNFEKSDESPQHKEKNERLTKSNKTKYEKPTDVHREKLALRDKKTVAKRGSKFSSETEDS